ncbi:hypothetical protein P4O66_016360 [Electrophorus voltai]|uniref:Uncharacterized protein n=1 Tax=Electrophorus voltai TaxID=2609070 RepID=A0AAD9DPF2_9TELE|nr:hypothetical protein P4O66_016360 [Electrophorus voltai]
MTLRAARHLAGPWPWLLLAALQALGQAGLELAAAVESERSAPRAVIKVTLLKQEPTGKPITLEGVFAGSSAGYAEGKLMQVYTAGARCALRLFAASLWEWWWGRDRICHCCSSTRPLPPVPSTGCVASWSSPSLPCVRRGHSKPLADGNRNDHNNRTKVRHQPVWMVSMQKFGLF